MSSLTPLAVAHLGNYIQLNVYLLVTPSCNFQTTSESIQFESHPTPKVIPSIWRATTIQGPITSGITSVLLFHFSRRELPVQKLQVTLSPANPKIVSFMKISQETNKDPIKLDISELSTQRNYYQTFKFLSRTDGNPIINVSYEYMCDQKQISHTQQIEFNVSPPFLTSLEPAKVRNEGVLLKVSLSNASKYIARDVRLEVIPSSSYVVDESEILVADAMLPLTQVSCIYGFEFQRGEGITSSYIVESLTIKWSTGFEENCQMQKFHLCSNAEEIQTPVAISMIGSPQTQKLLTPFAVKFDVHNTTSEERKFTIDVDFQKESGLLPHGIHVFTTDLLPANGSQRISMEFIALKQGLLPFPELIISTDNYEDFRIDLENGVLILIDDTIPT